MPERVVRLEAGGVGGELGSNPLDEVHLDVAFVLCPQPASSRRREEVTDRVDGFTRDVDALGLARGLHPARGVYRVTPHVVRELLAADDAGDERPSVQPDANRKPDAPTSRTALADRTRGGDHLERR